jgi:hypothetical protein
MALHENYALLRPVDSEQGFLGDLVINFDKKKLPKPALPAETGRRKLIDLSSNLHCSVIGTCLSPLELGKLVSRITGADIQSLTDHEIHSQGVSWASTKGEGTKLIHKALDRKHEAVIKKFSLAKSTVAVAELWRETWLEGDIAGAYWAALTHPQTTEELLKTIFGEVHMLSHQVGAVKRADLRRLSEFKDRCAELELQLQNQQLRHATQLEERDTKIVRLEKSLAEQMNLLKSLQSRETPPDASQEDLKNELIQLKQGFLFEQSRRRQAELKLAALQDLANEADLSLACAIEKEKSLLSELATLEASMGDGGDGNSTSNSALNSKIAGQTLLYVGGRPQTLVQLREFVERHGGKIIHHDGGLQDRSGMLAGLASKSDMIFFPVDCVSHEAAGNVKRLASQFGKPYFPLRSSGLGSFVSALAAK